MNVREAKPGPVDDFLIFRPDDVDLSRSPLRPSLKAETYVLGAFNPGLTRLANGNLLLMVRVAEALRGPIKEDRVCAIRWTPAGYVVDHHPLERTNVDDPRVFRIEVDHYKPIALTSLSWLLPVELTPDGREIVATHYDRAIAPSTAYQNYGVEDPRISRIGDLWYMTVCSVSPERHGTTLYVSKNGLDYECKGLILDHQNKDMCLFEGKIGDHYYALTRPLGEVYFAYPPDSDYIAGPCIQLAQSPDLLHWKPSNAPSLRARKSAGHIVKIGGGAPPVLTAAGWLVLYHGVEMSQGIGLYRTYWALLDRDDPTRILRQEDKTPLLEAHTGITDPLAHQMYLHDIVFTTGLVDAGDSYIAASGEVDLACRITYLPKKLFA